MELKLLIFLTIICIINLVFIFAVGLFLVKFRDRVNAVFGDLIQAMEIMWGAIPDAESFEPEISKTWDQKYEEELESINKRLRADSGLKDLSDPGLSWGEPPSVNIKNADGLSIKNIAKVPMNRNRVDRKN